MKKNFKTKQILDFAKRGLSISALLAGANLEAASPAEAASAQNVSTSKSGQSCGKRFVMGKPIKKSESRQSPSSGSAKSEAEKPNFVKGMVVFPPEEKSKSGLKEFPDPELILNYFMPAFQNLSERQKELLKCWADIDDLSLKLLVKPDYWRTMGEFYNPNVRERRWFIIDKMRERFFCVEFVKSLKLEGGKPDLAEYYEHKAAELGVEIETLAKDAKIRTNPELAGAKEKMAELEKLYTPLFKREYELILNLVLSGGEK